MRKQQFIILIAAVMIVALFPTGSAYAATKGQAVIHHSISYALAGGTSTSGKKVLPFNKVRLSFDNFGSKASKTLCKRVYRSGDSDRYYKSKDNNGGKGNCYGMACCAGLYYSYPKVNGPSLKRGTKITFGNQVFTVEDHIKAMEITFRSDQNTGTWRRSNSSVGNLVSDVRKDLANNRITVLTVYSDSAGGHAVAVIGFEPYGKSKDRLVIYDSYAKHGSKSPQYFYLYKNKNGSYSGKWDYYASGKKVRASTMKGADFTWTTFAQYSSLWKNRGKLTYKSSGQKATTKKSTVAVFTHTISYDLNGGTGNTAVQKVKDKGSFTLHSKPSRNGYTFKGYYANRRADSTWYVDGKGWFKWNDLVSKGYTPKLYSAGTKCTMAGSWLTGSPKSNYVFKAQWQENAFTHTISYDLNGGTGNTATQKVKDKGSFTLHSKPSRNGYTFKGYYANRRADSTWYVDGKGWFKWNDLVSKGYTPKLYPAGMKCTLAGSWLTGSPKSNYVFKAQWQENAYTHTVSYNLNGGTGNAPSQSVKDNGSFTIPNAPTKSGATFKGFYCNRTADSTWYVDGKGWFKWDDLVSKGYTPKLYPAGMKCTLAGTWLTGSPKSNYVFKAQWRTNTSAHIVSYELNGGTGSAPDQYVEDRGVFTIPNAPTKSGATFKGFYCKRTADSTWYVDGKGWFTWDDLVSKGYTPKLYPAGMRCTLAGTWLTGSSKSDYTFYAQWTVVTPAVHEHSYGSWTKLNDTQHQRVCRGNNSHVEKADHTWNSGSVTKKASTTAAGTITYTCSACGATKISSIARVTIGVPKIITTGNDKAKKMYVSWKKVSGATGYTVAWKKAGALKWQTAKTTGTGMTLTKMSNGSLYQYRVAATKAGTAKTEAAASGWSNIQYRYYQTLTGKTYTAGKNAISLKWKADKAATGYQVMIATNNKMTGARIIPVSKGKTGYVINGLKTGKTYYVAVRAVKKSGGKTYIGLREFYGKAVKVK